MAALGFLFADEVAPDEVVQVVADVLGVGRGSVGLYDDANMPDAPVIVQVVPRAPDFRTDVSVFADDAIIGALRDVDLAARVSKRAGKVTLASAPDRAEPFWVLVHPDGRQLLVRQKGSADDAIAVGPPIETLREAE
jgi:hypothetical protein